MAPSAKDSNRQRQEAFRALDEARVRNVREVSTRYSQNTTPEHDFGDTSVATRLLAACSCTE